MHAEEVANQANCPKCTAYGRLTLIEEDRRNGDARVSCKKCDHTWTISP
jgi:transposase-like protein